MQTENTCKNTKSQLKILKITKYQLKQQIHKIPLKNLIINLKDFKNHQI